MNKTLSRIVLTALFITALVLSCTGAASASVAPSEATLIVSDFSIYPSSLMPGDSGIVTFTIKNTYSSTAQVSKILIKDDTGVISSTSPYQNPIGRIGSGDTMTLSVPIQAGDIPGVYYPVLYVDFDDAHSSFIKYPFAVIIDGTGPEVSITTRPDVFEPDTTQTVTFTVGNTRTNDIEAVSISVSGEGVTSREGSVYLGTIKTGETGNGSLTIITTEESKEVVIDVTYRNGANWHTESLTLPLEAGISKTGADLVVNSVEIKSGAKYYTITGDVNNAGLTTAKGLIATTEGAEKTGTYPSFVVGSLDADGLSQFEVTFKNPVDNKVTLVFTYKDVNGNLYTQKEVVSLSESKAPAGEESSTGSTIATVLIVLVILAALAGGFIAWKKGKLFARK